MIYTFVINYANKDLRKSVYDQEFCHGMFVGLQARKNFGGYKISVSVQLPGIARGSSLHKLSMSTHVRHDNIQLTFDILLPYEVYRLSLKTQSKQNLKSRYLNENLINKIVNVTSRHSKLTFVT